MELFYAQSLQGDILSLSEEESVHCIRVMRHHEGDVINVTLGDGALYHARLTDTASREAKAIVEEKIRDYNSLPYRLTIACCPTKNNERFEWFIEKATELGVDRVVPIIGDRSERKVYKTERAKRIALAAAKQSLKTRIPEIPEPVKAKDFIASDRDGLKLIAYCYDDGPEKRRAITDALKLGVKEITILIGPEGDFSPREARLAFENGYIPVHLGASRLRTETAALTAAEAVYLHFI